MTRQCPRCKTDFETNDERKIFCTQRCRRNAKRARYVKNHPECKDNKPMTPARRARLTKNRVEKQIAKGSCSWSNKHPVSRRSDFNNQGKCKKCLSMYVKKQHLLDPRGQMLAAARGRAKKAHLPFDLLKGDITVPDFCPVFPDIRLEPQQSGGRFHNCSPSLDKMIPSLGYVKGNVMVMSWRANSIKRDATLDELILLGRRAERMKEESAQKGPVGAI